MSALAQPRLDGKKPPEAKLHEGRRWVARAVEELQRGAGVTVACTWPPPETPGSAPLALTSGERRHVVSIGDDDLLRAGLGQAAARERIRKMLRAAVAALRGTEIVRRRVASVDALD